MGELTIIIIFIERIMAFLIAVSALLTGLILYKKKKPLIRKPLEIYDKPSDMGHKGTNMLPSLMHNFPMNIIFPDINEHLPDLWGIDEPVNITAQSKNNSAVKDDYILEIKDGTAKKMEADGGSLKTTFVFNEKGLYNIQLKDGTGNVVGERGLKIVDYREEIIESTKKIFEFLLQNKMELEDSMTPRELLQKLQNGIYKGDTEPLCRVVDIFEAATYSLMEIGRKEYEHFYHQYLLIKTYLEGAA